jgi:hypothetical protein
MVPVALIRGAGITPFLDASTRISLGKIYMRANEFGMAVMTGAIALFVAGCLSFRQTDPARTATEQLLLSTATDHAWDDTSLTQFTNKKVYLDSSYFESYDSKYAIGTLRDALSRAGALLVTDSKQSEITIEARSGALSTDDKTNFLGIPAMGLPIPLSGAISTPEIAFYESKKQYSTAKFVLLAYDTQSRAHIFSSGPMVGRAHNNYLSILFYGHHDTDVPEMQKQKKHKASAEPK